MSKSIPFIDLLNENLKDPVEASLYLNEVIALGDLKALLVAMRDVVDSRGGIKTLADATGLHPKTLYRTLSHDGNPRLETLSHIFSFLELSISVKPDIEVGKMGGKFLKYSNVKSTISIREIKQDGMPRERNEWIKKPELAYG